MSKFEGMKACLAAILCLSCFCDPCDLADPCPSVPEFQFPCYVDVCTFPRQFCNSDRSERRCSPCTRRICADEKVPQACKYYCTRYQEPKTTQTTTAKPENVQGSHDKQSEDDGLRVLMGYCAIGITVLAVLVIFFGCYFGFARRQSATMKSLPRSYKSVGGDKLEISQLLRDTGQHLTDDLESGEARLNIYVPRTVDSQIIDPPTYTTEDPIPETNVASSNLAVSNNSASSDQSGDSTPTSDQSAAAASRYSVTETPRMVSYPYRTNPTNDDMHEGRHEKPWRLDTDRQQQITELNNISRRNGNGSLKINNNNMTSNQQNQSIDDASPAQNITTARQLEMYSPLTGGMINNDLHLARSSNDAAVNTNMIDTGGTPDARSEETLQRSYENHRTIPYTAINERRRVTAMEAANSQAEDRRIPVGSEQDAEYPDEVFSANMDDERARHPGTRADMNRQHRAGSDSGNATDETSVKGI